MKCKELLISGLIALFVIILSTDCFVAAYPGPDSDTQTDYPELNLICSTSAGVIGYYSSPGVYGSLTFTHANSFEYNIPNYPYPWHLSPSPTNPDTYVRYYGDGIGLIDWCSSGGYVSYLEFSASAMGSTELSSSTRQEWAACYEYYPIVIFTLEATAHIEATP